MQYPFLPKTTLKFKQNNQFRAPDQSWKCDNVLWGQTTITSWAFKNHPRMWEYDWKSQKQQVWLPYGQNSVFSTKNTGTNFKQNNQLWAPNHPRKYDVVLL